MEKGWVKLHRSILENVFLMHDERAFVVFMKLLLLVSSNKGEWAGGRQQLAEIVEMNPNTLYSVLNRLETQGIINRLSNKRYTTISICNWRKYQQVPQHVAKLSGNNASTMRQHSNKNKKENKERALNFPEESPGSNRKAANGPGYQKAKSVIEIIKQKKLNRGTTP